jgi:hypothetical protein
MSTDTDPRPRRFSAGVEHFPDLPASARAGTFADGMALMRDDRVGTFADGMLLRPDAPALRRVGTFADTSAPPAGATPARPRLGVPHGRPRPQAA